jgi:hypothetical protein
MTSEIGPIIPSPSARSGNLPVSLVMEYRVSDTGLGTTTAEAVPTAFGSVGLQDQARAKAQRR